MFSKRDFGLLQVPYNLSILLFAAATADHSRVRDGPPWTRSEVAGGRGRQAANGLRRPAGRGHRGGRGAGTTTGRENTRPSRDPEKDQQVVALITLIKEAGDRGFSKDVPALVMKARLAGIQIDARYAMRFGDSYVVSACMFSVARPRSRPEDIPAA